MRSRRRLLRTGMGITGAGLITTIAGCSGTEIDEQGATHATEQEETSDDTATDAGTETGNGEADDSPEKLDYTDWAYDHASLSGGRILFVERDVEAMLATEHLPSDSKTDLQREVDWTRSIVVDDISSHLQFPTGNVLTGSFDMVGFIENEELTLETTHGGFDIYLAPDNLEEAAVATDGTHLINAYHVSAEDSTSRAQLELLIDTYTGATDGIVETDDDFSLLAAELGEGLRRESMTTPDRIDDEYQSVVRGNSMTIDGERTQVRTVRVYETEADIDVDGLAGELRNGFRDRDDWELTDIYQSGRTAISEWGCPTDDIEI